MKVEDFKQGEVYDLSGLSLYKQPSYADYHPKGIVFVCGIEGRTVRGLERIAPKKYAAVTFSLSTGDGVAKKVKNLAFAKAAEKYMIARGVGDLGCPTPWTIGCDPEVFVLDGEGRVIPAWEFLPEKSKANRLARGELLHWDGWQAEFTTVASGCLSYLSDSVHRGYRGVLTKAQAKFPSAKLTYEDVVAVDPRTLETAAREHVIMGCAPSVNAYEPFTPPVENCRLIPFRSAGFHHHVSCFEGEDKNIVLAVKMADRLHGMVMEVALRGLMSPKRRQLYGRMGEYRKTGYGFEYRPPSSAIGVHPVVFNI